MEEPQFEPEELEILYADVSIGIRTKQRDLWKRAFDFYNEGRTNKLGMGCGSCYYKVLLFVQKKELEKQFAEVKQLQKYCLEFNRNQ